jgi:hypothetical protein
MPELVTDLAETLERIPVTSLDPQQRDAMRFALKAAARARRRRAVPWRGLAVAAAILVAVSTGAMLLRPSEEDLRLAQVELAAGARGEPLEDAHLYRLYDGSATFDVPTMPEGTRYRVVAGDGLVEVRGTRFEVTVEDDELIAVRVHEGHVLVFVEDAQVADLSVGERWLRAGADSEMTDDSEVTAGSEATAGSETETGSEATAGSETDTSSEADIASEAETTDPDLAFRRAFTFLQTGRPAPAARQLDALLDDATLDAGRRADILYWSAVAHERVGHASTAAARARTLLRDHPDAWRAAEARTLLDRTAGE